MLLKRDSRSADLLKLIGSDTLADFGGQLVALHRPVQRDWAARFGLPASATPVPSPNPTHPTAPPAFETTPAAGRRPWLVKFDGPCAECGTILPTGTEAIWRHRERRMLCLDCGAASVG